MMIGISGDSLSNIISSTATGIGQIHIRARAGDDVIRMSFDSAMFVPSAQNEVNAHHVYGSHGKDSFHFDSTQNVTAAGARVVGRIDDFDASQDRIYVDGRALDLNNLPDNVRLVAHQDQQWLLINGNILYGLEGARRDGPDPADEERHFIDWPTAWLNGVPSSADVPWVDPVNFVPVSHYVDGANQMINTQQNPNGTRWADHIYAEKNPGQTDQLIRGNGGDDVIDAAQGHDTVYGGSGDDRIAGGTDNDLVMAGSGNDLVWGGTENDTLKGQTGNDRLYGGSGDDDISGGPGDDFTFGDAGNDRLYGRDGNDRMSGGTGDDRMLGCDGQDVMRGDNGNDTMLGEAGDDTVIGGNGHDVLNGGAGHDVIIGGSGNDAMAGRRGDDMMSGRIGNDRLNGNTGHDTLSGGGGDDSLRGGFGADVFVFEDAHGHDVIRDFDIARTGEVIDLSAVGAVQDFADLMARHARQSGSDVLIDTGAGHSIRLQDIALDALSNGDFVF